MIACLSPNGRTQYQSSQPVRTLFVGTAKGIYRLERFSLGNCWQIAGQSLEDRHAGSLDYEPLYSRCGRAALGTPGPGAAGRRRDDQRGI
jgi:hypothetical protein